MSTTETPVKFWQGTNFWISALMLILAPLGIAEGVAVETVAFGFGAVTFVGLVRSTITTAHFQGWAELFKNKNWWNYLAGVVIAIAPGLGGLLPAIQDLTNAISLKNYGAIISALLTIGTMIFHLIKK